MPEYLPVTVEAAREIANRFEKDIVVIVSVDHVHLKTHFTTYGRSPKDKVVAAALGEGLALATGHELNQIQSFQDFRHLDAAKNSADLEIAKELLKQVQSQAGNLAPDDRRHVLLPNTRDQIEAFLK